MAFEGTTPVVIDVCQDCVHFIEYGRLDDSTRTLPADAPRARGPRGRLISRKDQEEQYTARVDSEHRARMDAIWGEITLTGGCGSNCEDHGPVDLRDDSPEPWFSRSACEGCGNALGGQREHATAWMPEVNTAAVG